MMKRIFMLPVLPLLAFSLCSSDVSPASGRAILLPKPVTAGGMPLMTALAKRRTSREFSPKKLPDGVLSGLLWAAAGINRPGTGKRTAPSAMDRQEIDVYVALEDGLYLYNAKKHSLDLVLDRDVRALAGKQDFVAKAPVNLIYVADMSRVAGGDREDKLLYAAADTGFIGQNVYLFCASEGLATVIRGYVDRDELGKAMKLKGDKKIILCQTVGYPAR